MTKFISLLFAALFLLNLSGKAQFNEPDYKPNMWVTDGNCNSIVSSGNTLFLGGTFNYVGPNTGGGALISTSSGQVEGTLLPVLGVVYVSISDGSGGWYIGGDFTQVGKVLRNNVAHILPNNTLDLTWNPDVDGLVYSIVVSGNSVYLGGLFSAVGGQPRSNIASVDATTGTVANWDPNATGGRVYTMVLSGSTLYAGGEFTSIGGQTRNYIAALNTTTGLATSWNPNASALVREILVVGGVVYVGGTFTTIGAQSRNRIAALNTTTGAATSWNPNCSGNVNTLAVSGNTMYVGGVFTTLGGQTRNYLGSVDLTTGVVSSWNPDLNSSVEAIAISGTTVYVGGTFTTIGGQARNKVGAVDVGTGNPTTWNPGASNTVKTIRLSGDTVYLGGLFVTTGGVSRNGAAAVDITTGMPTSWDPNPSGTITKLIKSGNTVYIAGNFTSVGGQSRNNIAAIDAATGVTTSWNPNANGVVNSLAIRGGIVYAGGQFSTIGTQSRTRLAAIDSATGSVTSWNPGASALVNSITIHGSNAYITGQFTTSGGQNRNRIAAIDLTTGLATSWDPNASSNVLGVVTSGNRLFAFGTFATIGGQPRPRLAELDLNTGMATSWNPSPDGNVSAATVLGSQMYIGGSFSNVGSIRRRRLAVVDVNTGLLGNWDPDAGSNVFALEINGGSIYASGAFSSIGGIPQARFVGLSLSPTCTQPATPTITASGTTTFCTGGSVTLSAPAGLSYLWSNSATTQSINVTTAGSYTVQVIDNGCTSSVSAATVVTVNPIPGTPTITASGPTTFCTGGSVTLSAPAGFSYFWSNGETTQSINVTTGGSYTVQVIDNGCTSSVSAATVVTMNPTPGTPTISASGTTTFCTGGSVTLSAPAGFSYLWSTSETTQSINVTTSGSYTVRVIDNGCTSSVSAATVVTVNTAPSTPSITAGGPTAFCTGGSVTLSAPAGFSYLWSNSATTQSINVTTAGSYTVQVIDNGCTSSVSATTVVTVNPIPGTPTITASGPTTFCTGGSVTLSAPAGFSYLWSNSATTQSINVTTGGSYTVQVIDNGCTSAVSAATVVTVNPLPSTPSITAGGPTTFCTGGSVTLSAPAGFSYLWSNSATTQSINVTTGGSYTVRVIDNGCTSSVSTATVVTVNPTPGTPSITAGGPTTFTTGGSVTLTAPAGFSYIWSTHETTQSIVVNTSGSYTVRTISAGCTSAVSAATVVTVTPASSNVWIWTGTDDYTNTANWNKGTLPDPGADSVIIQSGTCTVTAPVSFTRLYVAAGATLNLVQTDLSINTQLNVAGTVTGADQTSVTFGTGGIVLGSGSIQVNSLKLPAGQLLIYSKLKVKEVDATGQLVLRTPGELRYVTGHTHTSHWVHNASQSMVMDNPDQFVMEMHLDPANAVATGAWYNVGPPIQNYRVGNLEQGFTFSSNTYNNAVPTGSSLYLYDPTDNTWPTNNGYIKAASANQTLTDQQGVRLWLTQARIAAGPIEFKGNPFLTLPLTYNLSYCASGCTYGSPNGFNLVKNPLLTGLNFGDPIKTPRTNLSNALWIWRQSLGQFASYSGGIGVNGGTDIVKPGQAFFVQATGPAATLQITYDSGEQEDGSIFRRPAVDNVIRLKLTQGSRALDETAIRFLLQATTGYDAAYDAAKMMGTSTSISSMMGNQRYAINALPLPAAAGTTRIPLHLSAALTNQSISIETEALAQGTTLYLNHPSMSQHMPVQHGTVVQVQAGWDSGLELIVIPASITTLPGQLTPALTLIPNPATTAVQVHITATLERVEVVDQLGRTVLTTTTLPNQMLDISTLAAGTYLVKAKTAQGVVQQRLAVIR